MREDEIGWLKAYAEEVFAVFGTRFESATDRFRSFQPLLDRFTLAVDAAKANGSSLFHAVDEAHSELCIASAILENTEPSFTRVEYEPSLPGFDFRSTSDTGLEVYVDVKTIKPLAKDRWGQFEKAQAEGWLPGNVQVMLSKKWLGGEFWHSMFAARSRMLEYTLELEQKIAEGRLTETNALFVLALCGEGFYWHQDELEDFVSYYYSGGHRDDDPFSNAEARHVRDKGIVIARTISRFACMRRRQGDVLPKRLNWDVQPPRQPQFS